MARKSLLRANIVPFNPCFYYIMAHGHAHEVKYINMARKKLTFCSTPHFSLSRLLILLTSLDSCPIPTLLTSAAPRPLTAVACRARSGTWPPRNYSQSSKKTGIFKIHIGLQGRYDKTSLGTQSSKLLNIIWGDDIPLFIVPLTVAALFPRRSNLSLLSLPRPPSLSLLPYGRFHAGKLGD